MATATVSQAFTNNSDANFRLWGKWISDGLAAGGWTKATDSGQINWATVTAPAGATASQGYEVWSFADTLQATAPILIKIEYGSGAVAANPSLWITVGQSSDGAGNITGNPAARKQINSNSSTTSSVAHHMAAGTAWCSIAMWDIGSGGGGLILVIERTKDAAGADTSYGAQVAAMLTGGNYQNVYIRGSGPAVVDTTFCLLLPSSGTLTKGGVVQLVSLFPFDGNWMNPFLGALFGFVANLSYGTTISFNMYGASHSYYVTGFSGNGNRSSITVTILIRYE
jgi:hypothetical protein